MLKKIAILTAVAGMCSTSVAVLADGPTVHGRISFGVKSTGGDNMDDTNITEDFLGTRLGVSGSNDLGNGLTASYLLEYQNDASGGLNSLRHANITLDGGFGQFRAGQQTGVMYRYIGANTDQSWSVGGNEYYTITGSHSLRMGNIAAYRFGAGPGGNDPITFDIQVESEDNGAADDEDIDSVTIGAATAVGPVKLQGVVVNENGDAQNDLTSVGFRAPLGSAEVRGHVTEDDSDNEAWGLLVMNGFGGGYSGMIGMGNVANDATNADTDSVYLSLTKSMGSGLNAVAEYSTISDANDDKSNTLIFGLVQSF